MTKSTNSPPTTGQDAFDKHKEKNPVDPQSMYSRGKPGTGPSNRDPYKRK
jgi:hypothetical protein